MNALKLLLRQLLLKELANGLGVQGAAHEIGETRLQTVHEVHQATQVIQAHTARHPATCADLVNQPLNTLLLLVQIVEEMSKRE